MNATDLRELITSLAPGGVGVQAGVVERIDMPHRVITVAPVGGPGEALEGVFERIGFAVAARGRPSARTDDAGAIDDALALIEPVDDGLLDLRSHYLPGGGLVVWVMRSAGAPAVADPDSGGRYVARCSYIAMTG